MDSTSARTDCLFARVKGVDPRGTCPVTGRYLSWSDGPGWQSAQQRARRTYCVHHAAQGPG